MYRRIISILKQHPSVPSQQQMIDEIAKNRYVRRAAARLHDVLDGTKRSQDLQDEDGDGDGNSPLELPPVTPEIRNQKPISASRNPKSPLHKIAPYYHVDLDRLNNSNIKAYDETITRRRNSREPIREQIRGVRREMRREVQQDVEELKYYASPRNWFRRRN